MHKTMDLLYHYVTLLLFLSICSTSESTDPLGNYCNENNNVTSRTSANIDSLLAQLVQTTAKNGFSATSYGKAENQVYGLAQCRGDVSTEDCLACIQDSSEEIRKRCPNEADARIWYDFCFLRYNTMDFRGKLDTGVGILYKNVEDVTDPEDFKKKLGTLIRKINSEAVIPSNKGLGKGASELSPVVTLYALSQCTRDLSQLSCAQCLAIAITNFEGFCNNKKGCRVLYSSCYVRYEIYPFYFPLDSNQTSANASTGVANFKKAMLAHKEDLIATMVKEEEQPSGCAYAKLGFVKE